MSVSSYLSITTPVPVGSLIYYAGSSVPNFYLLADGSVLTIADYPELFAVMGDEFGGDGITTFAVPDLITNFIKGAEENSNVITPSTSSGSTTSTTLTADNIPSLSSNLSALGTGYAWISGDQIPHHTNQTYECGPGGAGDTYVDGNNSSWFGKEGNTTKDTLYLSSIGTNTFTMVGGNTIPSALSVGFAGSIKPDNLGLLPCIRYSNNYAPTTHILSNTQPPFTNYSNNPLLNIPTLSGFIST
jgi:microcystin-dependent protein